MRDLDRVGVLRIGDIGSWLRNAIMSAPAFPGVSAGSAGTKCSKVPDKLASNGTALRCVCTFPNDKEWMWFRPGIGDAIIEVWDGVVVREAKRGNCCSPKGLSLSRYSIPRFILIPVTSLAISGCATTL